MFNTVLTLSYSLYSDADFFQISMLSLHRKLALLVIQSEGRAGRLQKVSCAADNRGMSCLRQVDK